MTDRLLPDSAADVTGPPLGAAPIPDPRQPAVRRAPRVVFTGFDGLRAIAAVMVVVVHSSFPAGITMHSPLGPYLARAEAGVAVFFLISGFLLYRPFVAARLEGAGGAPVPGYLLRRFMRIFPLYWLALVVTLNTVSDDRVGVHGFAGMIQTGLLIQGYRDTWAIQGLTQAWTLDIEIAFYLAVPIYAWLLGRRQRPARTQVRVELAALGATYLASKALQYLIIPHRSGWLSGWNVWLPVWWDLFALGMALAVLSARYTQLGRQPRWSSLPGSGTGCWLLAAFFYWVASKHSQLPLTPLFVPDRMQDMGRHLYYGLFGLFLLLPAVFGRQDRGVVRPLLASRPLVFLGTISYGIYLWHTTVIDLVLEHSSWTLWEIPYPPFLALVLGLTILVSTVTNRCVERPAIALSQGWARRLDAWFARHRTRLDSAPTTDARLPTAVPADGALVDVTPAGFRPADARRPGEPAVALPSRMTGERSPADAPPTVPLPSRPSAPAPDRAGGADRVGGAGREDGAGQGEWGRPVGADAGAPVGAEPRARSTWPESAPATGSRAPHPDSDTDAISRSGKYHT